MVTCIKKHLTAACYCFITTMFEVFFFLSPAPPFFCFSFLQEPWVGDKQTVAPSKDVLPCKQLPLQDKLLLYPLQAALIPVHPNDRGKRILRTSVGIMMSKSQLWVTQKFKGVFFEEKLATEKFMILSIKWNYQESQ